MYKSALLALVLLSAVTFAFAGDLNLPVANPGFESDSNADGVPDNWSISMNKAKATVSIDETVSHSGKRAVRITNESPIAPYYWAAIVSDWISVKPHTTYTARFWAKGSAASGLNLAISFDISGEHRIVLAKGDFDWRQFSCTFTTPADCKKVTIRICAEDVTKALWADDVTLEKARVQLANLQERRYEKDFAGVFPRTKGTLPEHLIVCSTEGLQQDMLFAIGALQGIINRTSPRLYVIHPGANDEDYLAYMQEKGCTGKERRVTDPLSLFRMFKREINGVVVYDPELPGSIHAACMIAGVKNLLPVSAELADKLSLPVVMDLRGKWKRNVDAYRFVYDNYWDQMSHHVLAWRHPSGSALSMDYLTEFKVFNFWMSSYSDDMKGSDPAAEEEFINELFAATPGNVPIFGWPAWGDTQGVGEYTAVRWASEYGKFVPGTEFCTNLSIHTAIHPSDDVFKQKTSQRGPTPVIQKNKVYITLSVLESGDSLWYWQLYQRKIWADKDRGSVPVGWCMNPTLYDMLPLVAQWYFENATPNDVFFAAPSGLGYMNAAVYASRFKPKDRERVWDEYVKRTNEYSRRFGMSGIELYTDGVEPDKFKGIMDRFIDGMPGLDYIMNDFSRFDTINTKNANYTIGNTAVFHTLTRYKTWVYSADIGNRDRDPEIAYLLGEINSFTPAERPGFISAMVTSWNFYPSWIKTLAERLPDNYVVVHPDQMADLYRSSQKQ
ncbi:MAG: carbohydrate binding domain-containing protein [Armatimonadota bacterium]